MYSVNDIKEDLFCNDPESISVSGMNLYHSMKMCSIPDRIALSHPNHERLHLYVYHESMFQRKGFIVKGIVNDGGIKCKKFRVELVKSWFKSVDTAAHN